MNDVKLITIVLITFFASAVSVTGQGVYTPEKGSAERTAILGALRTPIERQLKQKIVFVTDNFSVQGTWAFVSGTPQAPSGGPPDYRGTVFQEAKEAGAFDNNFFALLRKTSGKWRVVKYAIGCTDVCFVDWWRRYRAPKAIFPYVE